MQKQILYTVICTILILTYGALAHAVTLSVSSEEGKPGDTVVVEISIDDTNGVLGIGIKFFEYDPSILTFKEFKETDLLKDLPIPTNNTETPGKLLLSKAGFAVPLGEGSGVIYEITFEVNADASSGKSPLTIGKADLADQDNKPLPVTIENGEFTVIGENLPPELEAIGDKEVDEGQKLEFTVSAEDPDGDSLTFSATDLPEGSTFEDGAFSWVPNSEQAGTYSVIFDVGDGKGGTASETITITVEDVEELLPAIREHAEDSQMLAFEVDFPDENAAKCYVDVWQDEFIIEAGQYLEYQIALFPELPAYCAGIDLHTNDGTFLSATDAQDQFGLGAGPQTDLSVSIKDEDTETEYTALGKWYHRQISLDALAGKTLDGVIFATVCEEHKVGKFRAYVDNIQITNGTGEDAGRVLDIYIDGNGKTATESQFANNENVNNSTVTFGEVTIGVHPAGKLPITWGRIKKLR